MKFFFFFIQVYNEEIKRFDQLNQGYRTTQSANNNQETKARTQNKKSLNDTKKNLGFQWDIPNKQKQNKNRKQFLYFL